MRLSLVAIAFQAAIAAALLGVGVLAIVFLGRNAAMLSELEEHAEMAASGLTTDALNEEVADARRRTSTGIGFVAVTTGGGLLIALLSGAWLGRRLVNPLSRLSSDLEAMADGRSARRAVSRHELQELDAVGTHANAIMDQLCDLETSRSSEVTLMKEAIEASLDQDGCAAAIVSRGGQVLVANLRMRTYLQETGADLGRIAGEAYKAQSKGEATVLGAQVLTFGPGEPPPGVRLILRDLPMEPKS